MYAEPKFFKHLKPNDEDDECVFDVYNKSRLKDIFIIHNEDKRNYLVFESKNDFILWYTPKIDQPDNHFHEIILGQNKQRMRFDIDAKLDEIPRDSIVEKEEYMMVLLNQLIQSIIDELSEKLDTNVKRDEILITESVDRKVKFSYHVICPLHSAPNNIDAKNLATDILAVFDKQQLKLIDQSVYKSVQGLRLLGANRNGRVKKFNKKLSEFLNIATDFEFEDTLINCQNTHTATIPTTITDANPEKVFVADAKANEEVLQFIKSKHFELRKYENGIYYCDRLKETFCEICKRNHEKDNTLIIKTAFTKNDKGVDMGVYYEYCRHYNYEHPKERLSIPHKLSTSRKEQIESILSMPVKKSESRWDEVKDNDTYDEPKMKSFYDGDINAMPATIAVKAQMKMGKTTELRNFVDKYFSTSVIRIISFRRTFSKTVHESFPEFKMYDDIESADINSDEHTKLIIQVESLYRLHVKSKGTDLLILDEIESILAQFSSALHRALSSTFAIFTWLLEYSKHVIVMDANLTDRSYNIIKKFRKKGIHLHNNIYKRAFEDIYNITFSHKGWLSMLFKSVEAKKRVVIATNCKREANGLFTLLTKTYKHLKIASYSSETPEATKSEHFSNVNKYWVELDILIYTPTVTAGCSFTQIRFDLLFGYFTNTSCDVETCRQMCGRVRNLTDKTSYICFDTFGGSYYPDTVSDIEHALVSRKSALYRVPGSFQNDVNSSTGVSFKYNEFMEIEYFKTDYYYLWINNVAITNKSRNRFYFLYIMQLKDSGAKVFPFECDIDYDCVNGFAEASSQIAADECERIAKSANICDAEAFDLKRKMRATDGISIDEASSYKKWCLATTFQYPIEKINLSFVETYGVPKMKKLFKSLNDICRGVSMIDSLKLIQDYERESFEYVKDFIDTQPYDLLDEQTGKKNYQAHLYAFHMIQQCGFECITDLKKIPTADFVELMLKSDLFTDASRRDAISLELELKKPVLLPNSDKKKNFAAVLRWINKALKSMYGLSISKLGNGYKLTIIKEFKFVKDRTNKFGVPEIILGIKPINLIKQSKDNLIDGINLIDKLNEPDSCAKEISTESIDIEDVLDDRDV